MWGRKKAIKWICLILTGLLGLAGCGSPSSDSEGADRQKQRTELVYERSMELKYAENFKVDYYEGGYTMLTNLLDHEKFLIVPEGKEEPEGLEKDTVILKRPIQNVYLVASSVMDLSLIHI